ncbi:MAG TPA: hypothetical protein VNQ79_06640 [Blastocatellia bacterium]|nr:hypothetical protein [Blastocatellia bacterium]
MSFTARTFQARPSELLRLSDPVAALDFDGGCALALMLHEEQAARKARENAENGEDADAPDWWRNADPDINVNLIQAD